MSEPSNSARWNEDPDKSFPAKLMFVNLARLKLLFASESGRLLSDRFAYLETTLVSVVELRSILERLVLQRIEFERFVPVRSCSERST